MEDNVSKVQQQLDRIKQSLSKDLMSEIGGIGKGFFVDTFTIKGFDSGTGFEAWAPAKFPKNELLVRTGNLRRSIVVDEVENDSVSIKSDMEYSGYINDGTDRMPARTFMGSSEVLTTKILDEAEKMLDKIVSF